MPSKESIYRYIVITDSVMYEWFVNFIFDDDLMEIKKCMPLTVSLFSPTV